MRAAWDVIVRVWLVAATWIALRRRAPGRRARLGRIVDPLGFARAAIAPAAGHVALAIAMLPRGRREEARITLLACRALHAFARPDAVVAGKRRDAVVAAVRYLAGERDAPPPPPHADRTGATHLDGMLAARLTVLRAALEALPGDAMRRSRAMIELVGEGLLRMDADRRAGAAQVLGEAVSYAARLAAPSVRPPDAACRAAGRALASARELAGVPAALLRAWLRSRAQPTLTDVVRLARWLPATAGRGTRAAAALLVATACAEPLRHANATRPPRLPHPVRAALAAAWSRSAYLADVAALDRAIRGVVADGAERAPHRADPGELREISA
ncbi:MAG TPA: hypothetical protein VFK02_19935 [Kofleriaceae bacterium]|nr:hypothetical protein [Kofleriaceae bacterium]